MRYAIWSVVCLVACASPAPREFFGDEKYLRFGLDPHGEAGSVIEEHKRAGEQLQRRVEGENFTALAFADARGTSVALRIITHRGIVVALDREPASEPTGPVTTYGLLAPPLARTNDADHDGFEEIFLEQRHGNERCVLVYRVGDVGFADAVTVNERVLGRLRCPDAIADVNRDERVELLMHVKLLPPALTADSAGNAKPVADPPELVVPLYACEHRFSFRCQPDELASYCDNERAARSALLRDAKHRLDVAVALRLGIELAALGVLQGQSARESVHVLDAAMSGLVLSEPERVQLLATRAWIARSDHTDSAGRVLRSPPP